MMYIGQQLPTVATARLKTAGYSGRRAGEDVAHEVDGDSVTVTFITASFCGGISRHTMTLEKFKKSFAVIRNRGAGR